MYTQHIGIDVSKQHLDLVRFRAEEIHHRVFHNTLTGWKKIAAWLGDAVTMSHVCLEATGRYGDGIATYLVEQGFAVSVVNPARIQAYGLSLLRRQKTDKADAYIIAQFCRTQKPDLWTPPDPAYSDLKIMVRHQNALQDMLQQERNRLDSLASSHPVYQVIQQHITFLQGQLEQLRQQIHAFIVQQPVLFPDYELLLSIPGIGRLTAAILIGEIGPMSRFDKAQQLAAYAGLTPQHRRSGSSIRGHTRISKRGNAHLRRALYFPAMVAIRHNPTLSTFAQRLKEHGKAPKSVIVAVMRKLLHMAFGILRSRQPFDPQFRQKQLSAA